MYEPHEDLKHFIYESVKAVEVASFHAFAHRRPLNHLAAEIVLQQPSFAEGLKQYGLQVLQPLSLWLLLELLKGTKTFLKHVL